MATNPNMIPIQTVEVGAGGQAAIEFTNIPQTYTDLVIKGSVRTTLNQYYGVVHLSINGVNTNQSTRRIYGDGSTVGSDTTTPIPIALVSGNGATANTFGTFEIYIPNYAGSTAKSLSSDSAGQTNNATGIYTQLLAGLWNQTSAISSISLYHTGYNLMQYSTATLYGVTSAGYGAKATGGIITSDANYYYHTFTTSGTFTPTQSITADVLMVGGGGSGSTGKTGTYYGSGGGAGQVIAHTSQSLTTSNYTVTIGAGAAAIGGSTLNVNGNTGAATQFTGLTSANGGGGGLYNTGTGGTSGNGYTGGSPSGAACGGGGGSGANGVDAGAPSGGAGGNGGNGTTAYGTWLSATGAGTLVSGLYYIGGGGAGSYPNGYGGYGGGGGDPLIYTAAVQAGKINTGSGGAGGNYSTVASGTGGSGIVIVRYAK